VRSQHASRKSRGNSVVKWIGLVAGGVLAAMLASLAWKEDEWAVPLAVGFTVAVLGRVLWPPDRPAGLIGWLRRNRR